MIQSVPLVTVESHVARTFTIHRPRNRQRRYRDGRFNIGAVSINPVKFALEAWRWRQLRLKQIRRPCWKYSNMVSDIQTGDMNVSETLYGSIHSSGAEGGAWQRISPWPTSQRLTLRRCNSVNRLHWSLRNVPRHGRTWLGKSIRWRPCRRKPILLGTRNRGLWRA